MIDVYLEELANSCEIIEEIRKFPNNYAAVTLLEHKREYCEEMIEKIQEWLING